ncbi:MAG: PadR family transcriptional regulator, partial [Gemmatimonadota bacterium]|nr:PadR family transcriptional regulator [Gemmatimonadota bacterium]
MRENRSRYAVLGALTIKPMSGYDLRTFFDQSVRFFWNESYGQIYPILKKLAAEGLVAPAPQSARGGTHPRRTVYVITARGRAALAEWLGEPADQEVGRIEILLKLFFAPEGEPAAAREHVSAFREYHVARLAQFDAVEARIRREHAGRAELLGERREDEVRLARGDDRR